MFAPPATCVPIRTWAHQPPAARATTSQPLVRPPVYNAMLATTVLCRQLLIKLPTLARISTIALLAAPHLFNASTVNTVKQVPQHRKQHLHSALQATIVSLVSATSATQVTCALRAHRLLTQLMALSVRSATRATTVRPLQQPQLLVVLGSTNHTSVPLQLTIVCHVLLVPSV